MFTLQSTILAWKKAHKPLISICYTFSVTKITLHTLWIRHIKDVSPVKLLHVEIFGNFPSERFIALDIPSRLKPCQLTGIKGECIISVIDLVGLEKPVVDLAPPKLNPSTNIYHVPSNST